MFPEPDSWWIDVVHVCNSFMPVHKLLDFCILCYAVHVSLEAFCMLDLCLCYVVPISERHMKMRVKVRLVATKGMSSMNQANTCLPLDVLPDVPSV